MKTSHLKVKNFHLMLLLIGWCGTAISVRGSLVATWGDKSYVTLPAGLGSVKAVSTGSYFNVALAEDGTVSAWDTPGSDVGASVPAGLSNVVAVAAGFIHAMALRADGTVVDWGVYGNLGNVPPAGLSNVVAVAAGYYHCLALRSDGTVVAWGSDVNGQTDVPLNLSNVVSIAGGYGYSLALKADGTVVSWGDATQAVPAGLSNVVAISAGWGHCLALRADGSVIAWGQDISGSLVVPTNAVNVIRIAAGYYQSLALRADGTVVAWGADGHGEGEVPAGLSHVTAIAAGIWHNLALTSQGPVQILQGPQSQTVVLGSNVTFSVTATGNPTLTYQWLYNGNPLADGSRISGSRSPNLIITNLVYGDAGSYSVTISNSLGAVPGGTAVLTVIGPPVVVQKTSNPTLRAGSDLTLQIFVQGTQPITFQWYYNGNLIAGATNSTLSLTNLQSDTSGTYTLQITNPYGTTPATIVVTTTDSAPYVLHQPVGRVVTAGGQAVISVSARGSVPLSYQWRFNGADIPGGTNDTLVLNSLRYDQTGYYNAVITNAFGQISSAKVLVNVVQINIWGQINSATPTNVPPGLTNLVAIAAGNNHILALKADGGLASWGASPYAYPSINIPPSATNAIAIAAAGSTSMILRSNGTVVVWGIYNNLIAIPPSVTNVVAIANGANHFLAAKADGTVVGWGDNVYGEANPPAGLSNVVAVATGDIRSFALKNDGTLVSWGSDSVRDMSTVPPPGLSNVIAISAAYPTVMALKSDGTFVTWGNRFFPPPVDGANSNAVAIATGLGSQLVLNGDGTVSIWGNGRRTNDPVVPGLSNVTAIAQGGSMFSAALVGNGSPAMTVQPFDWTVTRGATVQFHGRAAGVLPLQYQWLVNGEEIQDATNSDLVLTNVQGADTGGYQLRVVNALGSALSRMAQLSIPFNTNLPAALNATNLTWLTWSVTNSLVGNPPMNRVSGLWFAQNHETHDGDVAAQSGRIINNQQSVLQTDIGGPGTLTFWWKVSSEEGFDFLSFNIDTGKQSIMSISGEMDWQPVSIRVPSGVHHVQWVYSKDVSLSVGQDAGWVDQVVYTSDPPRIQRQPFDQTVPVGTNVTMPVVVSDVWPLTYQWLKNSTNLPGATTPYLVLTNVTQNDAGTYAVRIVNSQGGSVISSNATLVVLTPQLLSQPLLLPDGTFMATCCGMDGSLLSAAALSYCEAQASTDLVNWVTLPGGLSVSNGVLQLHDAASSNYPQRFYRVIEH